MSRRVAREVIFKTLFELDLNLELDLSTALQTAKDEHIDGLTKKDDQYVNAALRGVIENLKDIDEIISASSTDWKIERMGAVDRAILRLGVYEIKFSEENLKPNIIINEAVELAKIYGADNSGRFINGVLGGVTKK